VTSRFSESITARLVILFASVVTGTMIVVSAYLYHALTMQRRQRIDR
jgi:phage shock protein PspC (stress-responsive transcriptional regulator)